jgi:hypothetical protein
MRPAEHFIFEMWPSNKFQFDAPGSGIHFNPEGLKLKSIKGPHLEGKSLCGPHFEVRMALRAAMSKHMSYLVHNLTIIEHFLSFNDQNF